MKLFFLSFISNLTMKNEFAKYLLEMIHTQILPLETLFSLFETFSQWKATFKVEEDDKYKLKLTVFERTMSLLQIIINISPFLSLNSDYKNQVSEFITHSLERKIEILIKDFYLKSDSYYSGNPHKDETMIQDFQMYYQSLSTKIIAYSSLLRFKEITIFEFKEEAIYKTCASQVLNLIMYHKMNPIILKSCSIFLYNLFKHPNVEYATSDLKIHINIAGSLIDFLPILWFIGGINYETLCMMGSLYTKPIMSELDEVEFYDVGEQRVPQIQECFFYVIKVIKFFSNYKYQSLKATKTAQFCTELCQKVNFIKERNMALFKVWEMPNDNVKLMVCRTFSSLYPGIWTLEDVMFFREILREMKTFRRKNTDEVNIIFYKIIFVY